MKTRPVHPSFILAGAALVLALAAATETRSAGFSTAFTYQVRLTESGGPANGAYDLTDTTATNQNARYYRARLEP